MLGGSYFSSQRLYGDETQYTGWDGNNTDCILIWCRQERSRGYYDWLTVKRAQERGAKVICVDPRFTCTASKADIWLPIRPGSDMALVLAFINEIVHSDKCATEFARMYTNAPFFIDEKDADGNGTGYQLRESYLKEDGNEELYAAWDENSDQLIFWSGDWQNAKGVGGPKAFQWLDAEATSWPTRSPRCPAAMRSTARRTVPAGTSWWSTSPRGPSSAPPSSASFPRQDQGSHRRLHRRQPARVLHARPEGGVLHQHVRHLAGVHHHDALAGNFDSKGGQNIGREPATGYDSFMFDVVPNKEGRMGQRRKETAMNIKKLSVCQNTGYQDILVADDATGELKTTKQNSGGQVIYGQQGGFGAATTKAMAKGDPFQIYGYWQQTSEPILSIEGGHEIVEGFKNLDFFVNVDLYMTPSGELADIILPAAHPNEVDRVEWAHSGHGYPTSHTYLIRQPFHEPLGECRDDMDICFEFAEYMGVDMYWKDKYEFFDYMVKGPETLPPQLSCANFEEFRERISVTGVEMATVKNAPKYETGFMRKTSDFRPGFNTMYRGNKMGSVYRFPGAKKPDGTVIPPHPQSDNGKMELWSEDCCCTETAPCPCTSSRRSRRSRAPICWTSTRTR